MNTGKFTSKMALAGILVVALAAGCAPAATPTPVPVTGTTATAAATATTAPTATAAAVQPTSTTAVTETAETAPTQDTAGPQPAADGALTWSLEADQGQARYRVTEQLAGNDLPNDAVGVTDQVSGNIVLLPDGTIDSSASKFVVNVASLKTDVSMRDGFVSRNVLQTGEYPEAVFIPKEISGLTFPLPESGDFSFQLTGDLTIRNVTKPVTWDVTGQLNGTQATGLATTSFTFGDFELTQPRVPRVLSIADQITLELEATLNLAQP